MSEDMEFPKSKLDRLAVLNIFDKNQVFWLFKQEKVNISLFVDLKSTELDVPKTEYGQQLVEYLRGTCKRILLKASNSVTDQQLCRYLFYLLSVSCDTVVVEECYKILVERIKSAKPFSIDASDLVTVFVNYGTVKRKLWPAGIDLHFKSPLVDKVLLEDFEEAKLISQRFPRENLLTILKLLYINIQKFPKFSDTEKCGLFHMMLNLIISNSIVNDVSLKQVVRKILQGILYSFSEEEWSDMGYRKIEDIAEVCLHDELLNDNVGLIQRIESIPVDTERGTLLQRCVAHMAFQEMLSFDTINLRGCIMIEDVIWMMNEAMKGSNKDIILIYSIVKIVQICIDVQKTNKAKLKEVITLLNQWRNSIPDVNKAFDATQLTVKDLMIELEYIMKNEMC